MEMGETPLKLRRTQLALTYWTNLKGHDQNHLGQVVLKSCQEKEGGQIRSFDSTLENNVNNLSTGDKVLCPYVPVCIVPLWILEKIMVDLNLLERK